MQFLARVGTGEGCEEIGILYDVGACKGAAAGPETESYTGNEGQ